MKQKLISLSKLPKLVKSLKLSRKKIVFTNGTFDILHLGHVTYLQKARKCGDLLVVGLNSDSSVKSYKGPDRPINPQGDRAGVLAALECVDYIVIFNEPAPLSLILKIKPNVLVKGADWKKSQIAGAKEVESWGGKVVLVNMVEGRSSTRIIEKMKAG